MEFIKSFVTLTTHVDEPFTSEGLTRIFGSGNIEGYMWLMITSIAVYAVVFYLAEHIFHEYKSASQFLYCTAILVLYLLEFGLMRVRTDAHARTHARTHAHALLLSVSFSRK